MNKFCFSKSFFFKNWVRPNIRFSDIFPTPLLSILYMTPFSTIFNKISIYLRLDTFWAERCGKDRLGGPSAAARTGRGEVQNRLLWNYPKNHLFRFCNKTAFLLQKFGLEAFGGILFLLVLPLILEHFNLVRRTEFVRTVSRHIAYGRRILKIWRTKKVVKINKKIDTRNQLV